MSEKEYIHYFPPANIDDKFKDKIKHTLVDRDNFEDILNYIKQFKLVAVDLETSKGNAKSALDMEHNVITGISVAVSSLEGYYFSVNHINTKNIIYEQLVELVQVLMSKRMLFYNARFDLGTLWYKDIPNIKDMIKQAHYLDVQILVYLADTNVKGMSLKEAAKHFLGRVAPTYEEVVGKKNIDMAQISGKDVTFYAVCDTINTYGLYEFLIPILKKECPFIIKLDNNLVKSFVTYYDHQYIYFDQQYIEELADKLITRINELEEDIYAQLGNINLNSNKQLAEALIKVGIHTGEYTKTGSMKLSKDVLASVDHPLTKKIVERDSLSHTLSTYVQKFIGIERGRVSYNIAYVPTGRLASGNRKNPYYLNLNAQNLVKPKTMLYKVEKTEETCNSPYHLFGYKFTPLGVNEDPKEYKVVEGLNPEMNVRRIITTPSNDYLIMRVDFKQQELVVASVLFQEPVWYNTFLEGGDVHWETARKVFGENATKDDRSKSKAVNFGVLYGATYNTIARTTGMEPEEAKEFLNKYWQAVPSLKRNIDLSIHKTFKNNGVVHTLFGRPRRLKYYLSSPDYKQVAFGKRSVINTQVQGTCGDICRICLVKLANTILNKYSDKIQFALTVHDEFVFYVKKDWIKEAYKQLKEILEIRIPGTDMKLNIDVEIGRNYGLVFPFKLVNDEWVPNYE